MIKNRRILAVVLPVADRGYSARELARGWRQVAGGARGRCDRRGRRSTGPWCRPTTTKLRKAAEAAGIAAPFRRPEGLSGDRISDLDVLSHALEATEAVDRQRYDIVVMLQPTSPLRSAADVSATLRMLVDGGWELGVDGVADRQQGASLEAACGIRRRRSRLF